MIPVIRAQQTERENLAALREVDPVLEGVKSPISIFKPKPSPKPRLFSGLKKDGRSRSNSSVLGVRRYSTDSILGDRMDSIGRRLSRDLTNSPPDLGHRFETFGKGDGLKFESLSCDKLQTSGISKSNETISGGTVGHTSSLKPDLPIKSKKHTGKRPKISFECYDRDKSDDEKREHELAPVREGLEPPIFQEDRSKAVLRHKLHNELRSKYGPTATNQNILKKSATNRIDADIRPPLPKKNLKHQRQKSLDGLDVRKSPRETSPLTPKHKSDNSGGNSKVNTKSQISLERLSREDLLRLSHSSQSEIHEYLKNSMSERQAEPP